MLPSFFRAGLQVWMEKVKITFLEFSELFQLSLTGNCSCSGKQRESTEAFIVYWFSAKCQTAFFIYHCSVISDGLTDYVCCQSCEEIHYQAGTICAQADIRQISQPIWSSILNLAHCFTVSLKKKETEWSSGLCWSDRAFTLHLSYVISAQFS